MRADRERFRIRRDEDGRGAGRERAAACAKYFYELPGEDVLGEVPGVQAIHASGLDLPQMRERVDLVRLETFLAALRDHARIEVHPVPANAMFLEQLRDGF